MAKFDVRELNYITCGKKQNTFNISYCYTDDGHIAKNIVGRPANLSVLRTTTFFGDLGEYSTMSQQYASNKCSFYDINHKIIVHNLYDIEKSLLKTTAKKHSQDLMQTENIDMFMPQLHSDFLHICQFENYAYGLTQMTNQSPVILSVVMNNNSNFDITYHYNLSNDTIQTFTCPKPDEVLPSYADATSYDQLIEDSYDLSDTVISTIFNAKRSFKNIMHNYVVEIPEDKEWNDYSKGYIQSDMLITKNHLNYSYTMDMDANFNLSGCREYCNIDVCGNQLYMTYRDNIDYSSGIQDSITYVGGVVDSSQYDSTMLTTDMQLVKKPYGYQHVEVLDSWNRYDGKPNAGHKPSMFSLRLVDIGLNESTINEEAKAKLRENIRKNVRAIIDSITPANCQLFNIYFEGR